MLEIINAVKSFIGTKAKPLDGASLYIGEAEIAALMGNSGEGKSTVARLLCGLEKADSGVATLNGETLFEAGIYIKPVGSQVALIPQQPYSAFDPRQSLGSSVSEPMLCRKIAKNRKDAWAMAAELFREVSLSPDLLTRLPSQVSGGQAQRAAIARALGISPKLLIADEATSMLDPASQDIVAGLLKSIAKSRGLSILLISHDIGLVKSAASCAYTLSSGKIYSSNDIF